MPSHTERERETECEYMRTHFKCKHIITQYVRFVCVRVCLRMMGFLCRLVRAVCVLAIDTLRLLYGMGAYSAIAPTHAQIYTYAYVRHT